MELLKTSWVEVLHLDPQDTEENGERSNKILKDHSERIAGLGGIMRSPGFKKHHETPPQ